jgi:DNA-binding CsgD family transcriptional regulator
LRDSKQAIADAVALCDPAAEPSARAAGLLRALAGGVPYAAAAVTVVDLHSGRHRLLASRGYARSVIDYLLDAFVARDYGWQRVRSEPEAVLSWNDVPRYRHSYSAREVLRPHGFAEGTSICLLDGQRLVGARHVNIREPELCDEWRGSLAALRTPFTTVAAVSTGRAATGLSQREVEILRLVGEGLSNSEIAEQLIVARRTVATHVEHILEKLEVRNRVDASVKALRLGLL